MEQTEQALPETRDKILAAAKKLFATKGFDGASIRDIADTAGVNKSLVHYYFKSKSAILEELSRVFLNYALSNIEGITNKYRNVMILKKGVIEEFVTEIMDFLIQEKQLLNILILEALKSGSEHDFIFELIGIMQDWMFNTAKEFHMPTGDEKVFKTERFYFQMVPILIYTVFEDKMIRFENITVEESRKNFVRMLKKRFVQNQMSF